MAEASKGNQSASTGIPGKETSGGVRGSKSSVAFLLAITILLVGTAVAVVALRRRAALGADPGLVVDDSALDLGVVWMQAEYRFTLPIRNTGNDPMEISEFKSSCRCLSVEPTSLVVPALATGQVEVVLRLLPTSRQENQMPEYAFSVPLAAVVKSHLPRAAGWSIHGTARRVLRESLKHVDFGDSRVRGRDFPVRKVKWEAVRPLTVVRAKCPSGDNVCQVVRSEEDPSLFWLFVRPRGDLPVGRFEFPVSVFCSVDEGREFCAAQFAVFGNVVSDVEASPEVLLLGAVNEGEALEQTVWLRSRSGGQWEATAEASERIVVEPRTATSTGEHAFRITTIPDLGTRTTTVHFRVRQAGEQYSLEIPVKYVGLTQRDTRAKEGAGRQ